MAYRGPMLMVKALPPVEWVAKEKPPGKPGEAGLLFSTVR
jgi:hypothetical protein